VYNTNPSLVADTGLSQGAKIGVGVGVGFGILLLLALSFIGYQVMRRRREEAAERVRRDNAMTNIMGGMTQQQPKSEMAQNQLEGGVENYPPGIALGDRGYGVEVGHY